MDYSNQKRLIRRWIIFFMIALALSGMTAFPLESEMRVLVANWPFDQNSALYHWMQRVYNALWETNLRFPFLAYGYDWLAFAHLVIAIAFIGPYKDPIKNKWVIEFGMIAC